MSLQRGFIGDELNLLEGLETIEDSLEELSRHMINILKDYRKKGLIGEEEYKKHTKLKKEYLDFLQEKRKSTAVI